MFNKIKKGGKDTNPYKGYTIKYGQMTLDNCKNSGYVPMSLKWTDRLGMNGPNEITRSININGTNISYIYGKCSGHAQYATANVVAFVDLDAHFKGNIEAMKNCNVGINGTVEVIKWLEPIGGGYAKRLSKWFSCLFQKGGELYV